MGASIIGSRVTGPLPPSPQLTHVLCISVRSCNSATLKYTTGFWLWCMVSAQCGTYHFGHRLNSISMKIFTTCWEFGLSTFVLFCSVLHVSTIHVCHFHNTCILNFWSDDNLQTTGNFKCELKYKICKKYYTWLSMVQNFEVTSRKLDTEQYLYLINNLLKKKITTKQTNNLLFTNASNKKFSPQWD